MGKVKKPADIGKLLDVGAAVVPLLVTVAHEFITVPMLYNKGFPYNLEQATQALANNGLKAMPIAVSMSEANIKYRDCCNFQVVDSAPKQYSPIRRGSYVTIKYVTQDVIDESKRLFEEMNAQKAALKRVKSEKRTKREQTQRVGIKDGIGKIIPHRKNKKHNRDED